MNNSFSFVRLWAIILKEFLQIFRDKPTLMMMVGIPIIQLTLFGFAINTDPRRLPIALVSADSSIYTRSILKGLENTGYFRFISPNTTEKEAMQLVKAGKILFILSIPPNFSHDLIQGKRPSLLIEADATDSVATGNAVGAVRNLMLSVLDDDLTGTRNQLQNKPEPFDVIVHAMYNPLLNTQYNIIPGLMGVILTLTMAFITALAMTRERERGTMENLLATPVLPVEVILGKIIPYITIGYTQVVLVLLAAKFLFVIPISGSVSLLLILCFPFIAANLSMGLTFSTLARTQLQAVQGSMFFFLPSILLSGFMFPFYGMPVWAQWVGSFLPLTHFVIIARGILLKQATFMDLWPQLLSIIAFLVVVILIGVTRFRRTLD